MKFEEKSIRDIINVEYGKSLPKNKRIQGNYNVYGSGGITGTHNEYLINGPGIIIGRKGTVGSVYYEKHNYFPIDTTYYVKESEKYDLYFIYYLLKSLNLNKLNTHSAVPGLNRENLYSLKVKIPDVNYQKKISKFLNKLDLKINLNNQMISTLEEIASSLFKRWFIDFEFPDKNGNPYKTSGGEMIQSELGEIPKNWCVKKINEMFLQKKETFNPNKTSEIQVSHFSMPSFDSLNYPIIETVDSIKSNKTVLSEFSILFSKMNPEFQRVWLPNIHKKLLNVCSPEFIVLDAKTPELQSFLYFLCKSKPFQNYLINNATGSTGSRQRVKPVIAISYELVINEQVVSRFSECCVSIAGLIKNKREEIENLKKLRDTLLPKLLSGEIKLSTDEED